MKKIILLLSFFIVISLTGCKTTIKDKKTVGIAMPTKTNERWNRDGYFLKNSFEAKGYNVELRFSDDDINQQINDIQVLIADDVDLLIITPIDGSTLFRTLEDAKLKNIPVISYDRLIMNTDSISYYVSFDNYRVGTMQGQYIVDALNLDESNGIYNLEIVAGDPADNNALFFYAGAMDILDPYIESGQLRIPSGKYTFTQTATSLWSIDLALENMQNTLASYYSNNERLDAVLCSSDNLSVGVAQALATDYNNQNIPIITGQDATITALRNIVDGKQSMTIFKDVQNEAEVTAILAQAIIEGKMPGEDLIDELDIECIYDTTSYDNGTKVVPSYLLTPEVITVDNIDKLAQTDTYKWDTNHKYIIDR